MMAALCEGRTVHPALQERCNSIIANQSAEIAEMQGWLLDWYDREHEPQMKRRDERMLTRLASLSGEEFEIAFMTQLAKHHAFAVARARRCEKRAFHEELIARCQSIEEMQTAEINKLREWLCQWYERCRGSRSNGR